MVIIQFCVILVCDDKRLFVKNWVQLRGFYASFRVGKYFTRIRESGTHLLRGRIVGKLSFCYLNFSVKTFLGLSLQNVLSSDILHVHIKG